MTNDDRVKLVFTVEVEVAPSDVHLVRQAAEDGYRTGVMRHYFREAADMLPSESEIVLRPLFHTETKQV